MLGRMALSVPGRFIGARWLESFCEGEVSIMGGDSLIFEGRMQIDG
jgi:hypothetical protein